MNFTKVLNKTIYKYVAIDYARNPFKRVVINLQTKLIKKHLQSLLSPNTYIVP